MSAKFNELTCENIDEYISLQKIIRESPLKMVAILFLEGLLCLTLYLGKSHHARDTARYYVVVLLAIWLPIFFLQEWKNYTMAKEHWEKFSEIK